MMKILPVILLWAMPVFLYAGNDMGTPGHITSDSTEGTIMRRFGTILRIKAESVPENFVSDVLVEIYGYLEKDLPEDKEPGWYYLGMGSITKYEKPVLVIILREEEPLKTMGWEKHPSYIADLRVKVIKP